jgi:hypothetical protein
VTVRIAVDLNVRVRGNQTYSALDDANGPVAIGDKVLAVEPESGIVADARVTDVSEQFGFVYLEVDWHSFRDDPEATGDPACE